MKRLTLLRHAKSSWSDESLDDHDRPLAQRGQRDAPIMGERLAQRGLRPDRLLTSSAVRAHQTTELIHPALSLSGPSVRIESQVYLASPRELLAVLAGVGDDIDDLILVGHNPGLTRLVNMLLPNLRLINLPTAGAVSMLCDTKSWSAIDSADFSFDFYDYPKNTSAL